jgi:hypothetical protein
MSVSFGMSALHLENWQIPAFITVVSTLIIFALVTNICVLRTISYGPSLSMLPNCYLLSLAIGDFLHSLIVIYLAYINIVGITSTGCENWVAMMVFCGVVSVLNHMSIVINRYSATTRPSNHVDGFR